MKKYLINSYTILVTLGGLISYRSALKEITGNAQGNQIEEPVPEPEAEPETSQPTDSHKEEGTKSDEKDPKTQEGDNEKDHTMDESRENPDNNEKEDNTKKDDKEPEDTTDSEKEELEFTQVSPEYFDDALFIGDSRTIGLSEYGNLRNATFFAHNGMNVFEVFSTTASVPNLGKVDLNQILTNKSYGKIYIMLGINELGYSLDRIVNKYTEVIETIKALQPDAILYLQGNLHVAKSRSDSDKTFNNQNLNKLNSEIAKLADNITSFYLDVNEIFDDSQGNLNTDYTSDDTHVLGKYYADWCDWLATKAIVK